MYFGFTFFEGSCFDLRILSFYLYLGKLASFDVAVSCDAGRYVCNFTYYISIGKCTHHQRLYCLFVHVPPFECIPEEVQLEVLQAVLTEVTLCLHEHCEGPIEESVVAFDQS